ncbi:MAG TPA: response regulator transcription factor [Rectinemataceae bacterium]|nr:response regulator transcription factor [Rectinemataceae bacterium]
MRVLIVDDHPFIRKGIRETLSEAIGLLEIEDAADGNQAFELLRANYFDLVIVDVSMPGRDGLELIRDSLALRPNLRFLMMSVFAEREFAERAYRNGAMGYLAKSSPPSQFLEAVRRILGGQVYVSPEYAELLVLGKTGESEEGGQRLSDRELAVLRRYAAGLSLMEIGRELHLSVKTVSTHKTRAMEKLGIESNAELISYALSHGLARPPTA